MPARILFLVVLLFLFSCKQTMVSVYSKKFNKYNGKPFPKVPLTDVNGNVVPFDTLKGKVNYIDTWYVGCGPCYLEFKYIDSVKPYFQNKTDSVRFVFLCTTPPESHQKWLNLIKEKNINGDNYYISDSVYKLYSKELKKYCGEAPTCYILSPELRIMGTDVEPFSSEISAVYQLSASLKGTGSAKAFKEMARQMFRAEKGKPVSNEFKGWYKEVYNKDFDSLVTAFKKQ
jgi:hypothetical protein